MNFGLVYLTTKLPARLREASKVSAVTYRGRTISSAKVSSVGGRRRRRRVLSTKLFAGAGICFALILGVALRISAALQTTLAVDEAESSINALTVQRHGYPTGEYLSMPIYENTLLIPWPGNPEYEFRDSSYSSKGIAVYHGWLPFYSIAAAQALAGIRPDEVQDTPRVLHDSESVLSRTLVPRLPAIFFSAVFLLLICRLAWQIAGPAAAMVAITWAAFSERLVFLGYQARYYSLTLLMTVVVAHALFGVIRRGRWRDFLLLGIAEGLLFHTHQLCSVVMAQVALLSLPLYVRHHGWLAKSGASAAVGGLIIIPWAWAGGFFESATTLPKVYELFTSWTDWLSYLVARPVTIFIIIATLVVLALARRSPRWLPQAFCARIQATFPTAVLLIAWLMLAYVSMHVLVPAASYFGQRLTLLLQVPGILLISLVAGAAVQVASRRWAPVIAIALTLACLWGSGKLATFQGFEPQYTEPPVAVALAKRTFEPGTRFYATPNLHLTYAYYTGLPIQSVAPIRRSFLNSYPGPIVFIEHRHMPAFPRVADIMNAAQSAGETLSENEINSFRDEIWGRQVIADLIARDLPAPEPYPLPGFLEGVLADTSAHWKNTEENYVRQLREHPIFRDVLVNRASDLWMSFFYRFAGFESRIGPRSNIYRRLQDAEVELRPESMAVIFYCAPLRSTATPASGEQQTPVP